MLSDKIIKIGEFIYRVYSYNDDVNLEMGNAYIFGGKYKNCTIRYKYVLPFRGKLQRDSEEPGIYINKKNKHHVIYPSTERDTKMYNITRVFEITPETINTKLDRYLSEIDITDLKYTGNLFQPKIKETDDTGIKAVRLAIILKQIDFNSYAGKFDKAWDRANLRKALEKDSTLTFSKLKQYADLFDFEFGVILFDKKNSKNPISKDGKAIVLFNDEEFPIEDESIIVIDNIDEIINKTK